MKTLWCMGPMITEGKQYLRCSWTINTETRLRKFMHKLVRYWRKLWHRAQSRHNISFIGELTMLAQMMLTITVSVNTTVVILTGRIISISKTCLSSWDPTIRLYNTRRPRLAQVSTKDPVDRQRTNLNNTKRKEMSSRRLTLIKWVGIKNWIR